MSKKTEVATEGPREKDRTVRDGSLAKGRMWTTGANGRQRWVLSQTENMSHSDVSL